jgi:transcriptional regulator with XRE-family HTH domain
MAPPKITELGYSPHRLGQIVQRLREQLGWTQAELAEDAGMTREVLAHIEQGRRRVYLDAVVRVAQALGVPATLLLACGQDPAHLGKPLKAGELCLLVMVPRQSPLLLARVVRRTETGYRVRIGESEETTVIDDSHVRRVP